MQPHFPGELVCWDDNSEPRMWDFCGVDQGEHVATVEVTVSTDEDLMRFQNQVDVTGGSAWDVPDGPLRNGWLVNLAHDVRVTKFDREALFHLLRSAEEHGVDHLFWAKSDELSVAAKELGVRSALPWRGGDSTKVIVSYESPSWMGGDNVIDSVLREAGRNADKMQDAPGPRHLFVWIDFLDFPAAFEMREPPSESPLPLPDFVDVAWAGCRAFSVDQPALWTAGRNEPWQVLQTSAP